MASKGEALTAGEVARRVVVHGALVLGRGRGGDRRRQYVAPDAAVGPEPLPSRGAWVDESPVSWRNTRTGWIMLHERNQGRWYVLIDDDAAEALTP